MSVSESSRNSRSRLTSRAEPRRVPVPGPDASNAVHRGVIAGTMGTGPRGGRKVREREAAAAAGGVAPAAADDDGDALLRGSDEKRTRLDDGTPAKPPPAGGVDPADVDRKTAAVLEKKGFAAAAVARALEAVAATADDAATSFNEQKRRRTAAAQAWLERHAELYELPRGMIDDVKARRAGSPGAGGGAGAREGDDDAEEDDENRDISERAKGLIANGLLPIHEAYVLRNQKSTAPSGDRERTAPAAAGTAGAGAQDRSRTGKSLRAQRIEKAEKDAADLCRHVAIGAPCPHGDSCRRVHDAVAWMRRKPADLPGPCPFARGGSPCPYGLRCRFFASHEKKRSHTGDGAVGEYAAASGDALARGDPQTWSRESEVTGAGAHPTGAHPNDGSYLENPPVAELNAFPDSVQRELARNAYPMPRSDAILRRMDVPVRCLSYQQVENAKARRAWEGEPRVPVPRTGGRRGGTLGEEGAREARGRSKKLDLRGKLYVAPLTTVGNLPFRRVCVALGADVTISEMAMASNILKGERSELALLRRHPSERLFGVQVCGGHPDLMARCGEFLDNEVDCDFVDVNMGCPIDGVCAKGAGSTLLRDEVGLARMKKLVQAMSGSMQRTPLTIKVRMGYDDDPCKYVAHDILKDARAWGAAAATLHGRTRAQRYSRLADWRYIRRCAAVASPSGLPLVGNGDVFSFKDYERHMRGGTLATCMIGRGALIKPWVLTEIKERRVWDISASERLAIFGDFARHGLEHWGSDERGVETTRRFMMEWMSYTHRYVPVGLLESGVAQKMHLRPVPYSGRNELETLLASDSVEDWSRVTEMFLGKPAPGFSFVPKHKSNSYSAESAVALASAQAAGYDDDVEENG